jgi:phenylalanyl-tRNA synthetase alpha chain
MKDKLIHIQAIVLEKLNTVKNEADLKEIELQYFSRKGELSELMHQLKELTPEQKREIGALANKIKKDLELKVKEVESVFDKGNNSSEIGDITLPGKKLKKGHLHPITIIQREVEDLFTALGFSIIDGPELESDYYNFTALNMPPLHPARDMQDTFYVSSFDDEKKELDLVMRTQTSPVQIRAMKKYGAPLKAIIPGRCFRNEATDARHEHTFYQFEGMMIGENINFSNLKSLLEIVGKKLFGEETEMRMSPKYYPFVEPGNNGEYTCFLCGGKGCRVCKNTGWLEIVGAGLIHPDVLRAGGIDPDKYSGLAFGFGLTRLAMLKYAINDARLFNNGDLKFLEQF